MPDREARAAAARARRAAQEAQWKASQAEIIAARMGRISTDDFALLAEKAMRGERLR